MDNINNIDNTDSDNLDNLASLDSMDEELTLKYVVSTDGFVIEEVMTPDEDSATLISTKIPDGMFKPKWVNNKWIEHDVRAKMENMASIQKDMILEDIMEYLDQVCMANGFRGDNTTRPYRAISNYVGYPNAFREKAESLGVWVSDVFNTLQKIEHEVVSGARTSVPTKEELLQELPVYSGSQKTS